MLAPEELDVIALRSSAMPRFANDRLLWLRANAVAEQRLPRAGLTQEQDRRIPVDRAAKVFSDRVDAVGSEESSSRDSSS